jgi:hypothetical protein
VTNRKSSSPLFLFDTFYGFEQQKEYEKGDPATNDPKERLETSHFFPPKKEQASASLRIRWPAV